MRFLCLHGKGTSAKIFESQSGRVYQEIFFKDYSLIFCVSIISKAFGTIRIWVQFRRCPVLFHSSSGYRPLLSTALLFFLRPYLGWSERSTPMANVVRRNTWPVWRRSELLPRLCSHVFTSSVSPTKSPWEGSPLQSRGIHLRWCSHQRSWWSRSTCDWWGPSMGRILQSTTYGES